MSARDRKRHEYLVRLETEAAAAAAAAEEEAKKQDDDSSRQAHIEHQTMWVEVQVQQAMRRGDFDDLPGHGKPIPGLDRPHDPNWWLKSLIERERITGVLPPALALRTEDAQMEETLDREATPEGVRRAVDDFNARIVEARRQLQGGPPVITALRDAEGEVVAWQRRRTERIARQKAALEQIRRDEADQALPPWWRRRRDRST